MNRRGFLKVAAKSTLVTPLLGAAAQTSVRPSTPLPELGDVKAFVEDVYYDAPVGSHTQSRELPTLATAFHPRSVSRAPVGRIVYKRWDGKRWVRV